MINKQSEYCKAVRILVLSSSLDKNSRSRELAHICQRVLEQLDTETAFVDLAEFDIPNFDNDTIYQTHVYRQLHKITRQSGGIVMCSPVYNWGVSSELKKYVEYIGSTAPESSLEGALFDKVITFVNSGGLPHSYTAFREMATSLMLDFKCIINPYHIYAHNRHWADGGLNTEKMQRVEKSMLVMMELCRLLAKRTYSSTWEI